MQRNQRSNCQHLLDHWKSKRVPEKHLLLLYWLCQSLDCVDHNKLLKILKEMGIPDHLTCLLINLYAGQEATVRTGHGTTDWYCHPAYLTYMQSTSWETLGRRKHRLESRFQGEISITSYMQTTPPLCVENEEELKSLFPCPGYYKQCCDEHWGTCVSFNSGFLGVYAQKWDCWVIR